jgi:hypothetical protein
MRTTTTQRGNRKNQAKAQNGKPSTETFGLLNAQDPRRKIKGMTGRQVRFTAPAQATAKGSC